MRRSIVFALAIAFFAGCSTKEIDFQTPVQDDVVFYASFEQPADDVTRVYANEDLLLRWNADDRVSIFNKISYNQEYKFLGATGDNAGGFNKVDNAEFVTGNAISHVVSVYPYQASTKISEDEVITVTLPAKQTYAENTFGLGANTMVSVSSDNVLQYKNVGGYLMLKLYGEGVSVSSITLKGNNGEKLAGKASVTMQLNGVPSVTMPNDATTEITLTCAEPVPLGATAEESTQFWFVIPPVTFNKGFTITVNETSDGVFETSTTKSIAIERNILSKMSPLEVEQRDPRRIIYYTSTDDRIITPHSTDVFGATIVSNNYINGKGIITFDNDVTSIGLGAFRNSISLSSITIPDGVSSIGHEAFYGCSELTIIKIPNSVTSIGIDAFMYCTSLKSIAIPYGVTSIGMRTFYCCSSLANITIPGSVTSIGNDAFAGCHSLSSITIPNSVEIIGEGAFNTCLSLNSITIPNSVTSIGDIAFVNCSSLISIIVLPETPPFCDGYAFDNTNDCPIYVPDGSLSSYKVALNWRYYKDRIYAMSSFPLPVAVDLGLSVKWASFNLGASKPEEYGDYYAWGETEPYYSSQDPLTWKEGKEEGYWWPSYKWCMGTSYTFTKYCNDSSRGYNGFTDDKTVLDPEDDVANVNLGGKWRIPTYEECSELLTNCTSSWITINGVNGREFTSNINGNCIFLPASGGYFDTRYDIPGSSGSYLSSSLHKSDANKAWSVSFSNREVRLGFYSRAYGHSIRPVYAE